MSLILSGTDGLSDVDGSAATPAIRGTDTNTGIFFPAADTIAFSEGGVESMRLDSSGNLGIGTTSPAARLDVVGGVGIRVNEDGAGTKVIQIRSNFAGVAPAINVSTNDSLLFQTNNTERARITSGGNFLVKTADARIGSDVGSVEYGTSTANSVRFYSSDLERARITSGGDLLVGTTSNLGGVRGLFVNASSIQVAYRNSSATAGNYWATGVDSGNFFYIQNQSATGVYITPTGTSWTALSDERTKDIIEPITGAANKVASLRAVIGKYKTDEDGTRRAFLIAQDVQAVLPEAVNEQPDGRLGIQYTDTIPLLVAAIQEQQAIIQSLTARIEALEGKA